MRIRLITIGTKMPAWVNQGVEEYTKRLGRDIKYETLELPLAQRSKSNQRSSGSDKQTEQLKNAEGKQLLAAVNKDDWVVALDQRGKKWSSEDLSQHLANWRMNGQDVALLIGGPDGLSQECLARAQQTWSLSALTFPHPLVRVILVEQLYRAVSILNGHPYHR